MPDIRPESFERQGPAALIIGWSDGVRRRYAAAALRAACPCATCREKRSAEESKAAISKPKSSLLPVLSLQEARPMAIEHMRPVGNYAYNIAFSDEHDSGLFTFEFLLELGQPIVETP